MQQSALGGCGLFHDLGAEAGETILALPLDACLCLGSFRQVVLGTVGGEWIDHSCHSCPHGSLIDRIRTY